jgi:xanthine dehydrogenase accessory factor
MRIQDEDWPTFGWSADVRTFLEQMRREGLPTVLATLVRTEGSSPRPAGSQMAFDHKRATGYFSGGCLEADVANHAAVVLADGKSRRLVYGRGSPWIDIRLLCGGSLELLLERIDSKDEAVGQLLEFSQRRTPASWSSDGETRRVTAGVESASQLAWDGRTYRLRYDPPYRLIIVGGDPFALAMASLSASAGFQTMIVRPEGPDRPPPLPDVIYRRGRPDREIERLAPDQWTAVVTATHDDEWDDAAILAALRADTGYIGVLGATRRTAARIERLRACGVSPSRLAMVHAPIGVAGCGKAPWDVAVSVLAQIMQVRNSRAVSYDIAASYDPFDKSDETF